MSEDLTPKHLRCGFGSCPSVHRLEDGSLLIVGKIPGPGLRVRETDHGIIDTYQGCEFSVGSDEAAVVISPGLLGTLIEEKVREAVDAERERCAADDQ